MHGSVLLGKASTFNSISYNIAIRFFRRRKAGHRASGINWKLVWSMYEKGILSS